MTQIETVLGPITADRLGITMMHEHLTPPKTAPVPTEKKPFVGLHTAETIITELKAAKRLGLVSVVDATPIGENRDVRILKRIAEEAEVNIIVSTGSYKEPRVPAFIYGQSVDQVTEVFIRELTEGIDGTSIKAGIIKVGSTKKLIFRVEEKVLRAAARAYLRTGRPITTHATLGTMGREQVLILEQEGVDPGKVIIGHSDLNFSFVYHEGILKRGANLGFDTIGKERFDYIRTETAGQERYEVEKEHYYIPDDRRLATLVELIKRGYAGQIVLSSDISQREAYLNPDTHGIWGYSYLLGRFVPMLKESGVTEESIHTMLVENPKRILFG
ncbi:MAG: phosphotriesterase-related protein [Chloroflexi bacterium]|nr:phosphotriesterase-related protein [Chloroflexota bacterium]